MQCTLCLSLLNVFELICRANRVCYYLSEPFAIRCAALKRMDESADGGGNNGYNCPGF